MKRRALALGEAWAIDPKVIQHDASGMFFMVDDAPPENEDAGGGVVVVKIRGALAQFKSDGGDSYEGIVERVAEAFADDPKFVVLDEHSPGGAVAGLNECVFRLQRMSKDAGIPLIGMVNEMAASAGFALMCACSKRYATSSSIVGSIGVISQMVSIAERDRKDGVVFKLITSGARKADGHLHQDISTAAENAERRRNALLAEQFFVIVSKATGLPMVKIESLQAAIYLGAEAKRVGLVHSVMSPDAVLSGFGATVLPGSPPAPNEGNVTDRTAVEG